MAHAETGTRSSLVPILIAGSAILVISFSIRASYGVFQIPIAVEFDWPRSEFSMAIAIQNLAWGLGQPLFAAIGEKFGDRRALFLGAIIYALGLLFSAHAAEPWGQHLTTGVMVGMGVAGTGFGVVLAMVGPSGERLEPIHGAGNSGRGGLGRADLWPAHRAIPDRRLWLVLRPAYLRGVHPRQSRLPAHVEAAFKSDDQSRVGGDAGRGSDARSKGSVLCDAGSGLLLLWLSARLHHRAFPRLRDRGLRPDFARRDAGADRRF